MYIVLLETSGNQRYIFSTNKLRENVGASELTYQIGTNAIEKAINSIENRGFSVKNILNEPEIGTKVNGLETKTEVIIATSGKALILVSDKETAKKIVTFVTQEALIGMSGLTVHGAIYEVKDENDAKKFHQLVKDVHHKLETIRYQIPNNLQRFQRLPFAAQCNTSNLPAEKIDKFEPESRPYSKVSITKAKNKRAGYERMQEVLKGFDLIEPEDIEKQDWLGVIHADGNGVGETFLNFYEKANLRGKNREDYIRKFRNFSKALDDCTIAATRSALEEFKKSFLENQERKAIRRGKSLTDGEKKIPIVPLILGGDDLTIICDGEYAIKFTKDFLIEFENQAKNHENINQITKLGICAGVTIIKPHFPFHQAYSLAAELLQSAKKSKNISSSLSAFDYHVLYDSSGTTLEEIRGKTPFVARPYVVTPIDHATKAQEEKQKEWIKNHHFDELFLRVETMREEEDGKRELPNSQLHVLREGLFVADTTPDIQKEVDARAKLIAHRYETFEKLYAEDKSLFFDEDGEKLTHFLDALDIVEFWK